MTISTEEWNAVRAQVEDFYYVQKLSMARVVEMMKARGFEASAASYFRQLKIWDPNRTKQSKYYEDEDLVELVRVFWHRNYTPLGMLRILQEEFGYPDLTIRALKELRRRHKILARYGKDEQAKEQALGEAEEFVLKTLHHTVNHKLDFFYLRRASLRDAADTAYETMNRMGWCVKAFSPMCTLCEAITACWLHLTTFVFGALPDPARLQVPLPASEVPHMNLLITPVFTSLKTFLFSRNELFSAIFPGPCSNLIGPFLLSYHCNNVYYSIHSTTRSSSILILQCSAPIALHLCTPSL